MTSPAAVDTDAPSPDRGNTQARRYWLGLALAPLGPVVLVCLIGFVDFFVSYRAARSLEWVRTMGAVVVFGTAISYAVMLVAGWPYLTLLRRYDRLYAGPVLAGATLITALGLSLFVLVDDGAVSWGTPLAGALLGGCAGVTFCAASGVRWSRPRATDAAPRNA